MLPKPQSETEAEGTPGSLQIILLYRWAWHKSQCGFRSEAILITPSSSSGGSGFLLPHAARDALIAAAQRVGAPYQLAVTNGGVTDAAAAHLTNGGLATLEMKIPRRYSHSPVELLDLRRSAWHALDHAWELQDRLSQDHFPSPP